MSKIGELIVQAREERKLSQAELSKKTSISQVQISRIEGGEIKNPSFKDIQTIADALKIPLTDLAGGDFTNLDDEKRVKLGYSSLTKAPISIKPDINLVCFENGVNKFSNSIIKQTDDLLLISSNQIRKELGLEKVLLSKGNFLKNIPNPQRIRALTEMLASLSGQIERKTRVQIENELSGGARIKQIVSDFKLSIKPEEITVIEEIKEAEFKNGGFLETSSDTETLIYFQLFLEQILAEQITPKVVFVEINNLQLESFLIFLLEEAESLKSEVRLIVPEASQEISPYFQWQLFVKNVAPYLTDKEKEKLKSLTGSSALLKTKEDDSIWLTTG